MARDSVASSTVFLSRVDFDEDHNDNRGSHTRQSIEREPAVKALSNNPKLVSEPKAPEILADAVSDIHHGTDIPFCAVVRATTFERAFWRAGFMAACQRPECFGGLGLPRPRRS